MPPPAIQPPAWGCLCPWHAVSKGRDREGREVAQAEKQKRLSPSTPGLPLRRAPAIPAPVAPAARHAAARCCAPQRPPPSAPGMPQAGAARRRVGESSEADAGRPRAQRRHRAQEPPREARRPKKRRQRHVAAENAATAPSGRVVSPNRHQERRTPPAKTAAPCRSEEKRQQHARQAPVPARRTSAR